MGREERSWLLKNDKRDKVSETIINGSSLQATSRQIEGKADYVGRKRIQKWWNKNPADAAGVTKGFTAIRPSMVQYDLKQVKTTGAGGHLTLSRSILISLSSYVHTTAKPQHCTALSQCHHLYATVESPYRSVCYESTISTPVYSFRTVQ